jgi:glycolate oxidase
MTISAALIHDLSALVSRDALVSDPAELPEFGRDFWAQRGTPGVVVRAGCAEDVVATMRFAAEHGLPVVPRGAGTNISAGFLPAPERIMLDLRGMNRVLEIDPEQRSALVEPGLLNGDLQAKLAPYGLCFSPDPASAPLSSIGGNIAENSGGPHCFKYGVTVHHVAGIECVLMGGDRLSLAADDRGTDLLGVVIGSEGTLAVVTQAQLRLRPLPARTSTILAVFDTMEAATEAVSAIINGGVIPAALELMDHTSVLVAETLAPTGYPLDAEAIVLIDLDGDDEQVAADLDAVEAQLRPLAREIRRADDAETRERVWRGRLQIGQAFITSGKAFYIGDTTVPRERIPLMQRAVREIAERHQLDISTNGHAGDGNIHPCILYDPHDPRQVRAMRIAAHEITAMAMEFGGTLTGEHGVGSEKIPLMRQRFTATEIAAMRAVKDAFDPDGLLNPGVLLPDPSLDEPDLPRFAAAIETELAAKRVGTPLAHSVDDSPASAMRLRSLAIDRENLTVTAVAGLSLAALRDELAAHGYRCTLSDNATNEQQSLRAALSDDTHRAGARACLLAVDVTLPDGPSARFGSNAVKDVAGYDLKRLYTGSGDVFGEVREVTLQVRPG